MTTSVLWTLLPNGFDAEDAAFVKLSLVASPRIAESPNPPLPADTMLAAWPAFVADLIRGGLSAVQPSTKAVIPLTVTSAAPDAGLWATLIPLAKPSPSYGGTAATPIFVPAESPYAHAPAVDALAGFYTSAAAIDARAAATHPIHAAIEGLQAWMAAPAGRARSPALADAAAAVRSPQVQDLLAFDRLTTARIEEAAQILSAQGHTAAAAVTPLVPLLRRLKINGAATAAAQAASPTGIAAIIPSPGNTDLHQILGMLLDHPTLALRLGLRIDLRMPAFSGDLLLRIGNADGAPLDGPIPIPQPWSAMHCDPQRLLFTMQAQPDAPGIPIVDGLLDLRAPNCRVTDIDPAGAAQQLATVAASAAMGNVIADAMPPRRDTGLIVSQDDRRETSFKHALARNARFDSGTGPDEIAGAPVLYADDVTAGYRIDVSRDGSPFLSLMRRQVRYTIDDGATGGKQPTVIEALDEGAVDPFVPVEQNDDAGTPHLFVADEVFGWYDYSLAARRPGFAAGGEAPGGSQIVVPDRKPFPDVPLTIDIGAEPGTLSRLRYGSSYRFRARTADIAGNTVDPRAADPAIASEPIVFRRREAIAPPALVPRQAFEPGESLNRLVVRSDGFGQPIGGTCERHVLPPKASFHLAERHGLFDEALGKEVPQAVRDRLLAIGKREAGTLLDPLVPGPDGSPVPQPGLAVTTNVGAPPPQTVLPVPRGSALREGEYVVIDADEARLPYLADPASAGSAWASLPGTVAPLTLDWGAAPWPGERAHRLVLRAGSSATASSAVSAGSSRDARPTLEVSLPPGSEAFVTLSSSLTNATLQLMDELPAEMRKPALAGQIPLLTPGQPLVLVHAVQKPLQDPTLSFDPIDQGLTGAAGRSAHSTFIRLTGRLSAHGATSAKVALEAEWQETVDRGYGPVTLAQRRATVGAVEIQPGDSGSFAFDFRHVFGDAKRRRVTYRAAATSRFREYFTTTGEADRSLVRTGQSALIDVVSTRRPPAPKLRSVLPIFRSTRNVANGVLVNVRETVGVRLWLDRPWFVTGEDERIGVSVATDQAFGAGIAQSAAERETVCRWGADPFESASLSGMPHFVPEMILNRKEVRHSADIPDNPEGALGHSMAGVEVQFDSSRGLWFADIEFDTAALRLSEQRFPMLKLALTRFQPGTHQFAPSSSPLVTTDFIVLPPKRTLTARRAATGQVTVSLEGPYRNTSRVTAQWQQRSIEPLASPAPDVCTSGANPVEMPAVASARREITIAAEAFGLAADAAQAGRIVVEEQLRSWDIVQPAEVLRTIGVDAFDLSELAD